MSPCRGELPMPPSSPATDPLYGFNAVLATDPARPLLTTIHGETVSYQQAQASAGCYAAALYRRGVMNGDRVVVQVDKSPANFFLYLACLRLGAVYVPLNTGYTLAELEYFVRDAQPRVLVVRPPTLPAIAAIAQQAGVVHVEDFGADGAGSLTTLATSCDAGDFPAFNGDASALAALLYTSGTTGRSKGAMLTRGNIASNTAALVQVWRFTPRDVLVHALPIFHIHGLFVAIGVTLAAGSSMIFLNRFDAAEVLAQLPRATVLMGVPTFYTRLLQLPGLDTHATACMRLFISGSAPLLADTHREFHQRTGHRILERYGMSETMMNASNPYDGERIAGSVGLPVTDVRIRITDPASGAVVPQGETGMIEVRGPNVFAGYWQMPEKTRSEFRGDGYFITGDLGRFDAKGYLYIVGRGKDLIISGGFNVYPIEVESEIDALPGVMESAVIGVPHPDFGEGVTAVVVMQEPGSGDEKNIRDALEQRLAKFKLPKRVLFVDELPRNTMGKVQKSILRATYRDLYNAASDAANS
jgi:malonyl-CoA/methylmalonyl-CoA synthetase